VAVCAGCAWIDALGLSPPINESVLAPPAVRLHCLHLHGPEAGRVLLLKSTKQRTLWLPALYKLNSSVRGHPATGPTLVTVPVLQAAPLTWIGGAFCEGRVPGANTGGLGHGAWAWAGRARC